MKKLLLEVEVTPRGIRVETSLPPGWDLPWQPRPRGKEEAWGRTEEMLEEARRGRPHFHLGELRGSGSCDLWLRDLKTRRLRCRGRPLRSRRFHLIFKSEPRQTHKDELGI